MLVFPRCPLTILNPPVEYYISQLAFSVTDALCFKISSFLHSEFPFFLWLWLARFLGKNVFHQDASEDSEESLIKRFFFLRLLIQNNFYLGFQTIWPHFRHCRKQYFYRIDGCCLERTSQFPLDYWDFSSCLSPLLNSEVSPHFQILVTSPFSLFYLSSRAVEKSHLHFSHSRCRSGSLEVVGRRGLVLTSPKREMKSGCL